MGGYPGKVGSQGLASPFVLVALLLWTSAACAPASVPAAEAIATENERRTYELPRGKLRTVDARCRVRRAELLENPHFDPTAVFFEREHGRHSEPWPYWVRVVDSRVDEEILVARFWIDWPGVDVRHRLDSEGSNWAPGVSAYFRAVPELDSIVHLNMNRRGGSLHVTLPWGADCGGSPERSW
jgi:hypothetical protein